MEKSNLKNARVKSATSNFSVFTLQSIEVGATYVSHWSKGLTMFIVKDGINICLNEEEIKDLVKSLPRTIGGKY